VSRRDDGPLFDILVGLTDLPFWVSIAAGAFFFLSLTYIAPLFAGISMTGRLFADVFPMLAPWFLAACLLAGMAGLIKRGYRRLLLSRTSDVEAVRKLAWPQLELIVGQAYRAQQYVVTERGGAQPDGGIDLDLWRAGERVIVQCKQWKRQVPVEKVRELLGVVTGEGASRGVLVAPGGFTRAAREFAHGKALELVDAEGLLKLKRETPVRVDFDPVPAAAPSCPDCGKMMVHRTSRKGPTAGSTFWGCSGFPGCRGTRAA
jgi:restriction system protein